MYFHWFVSRNDFFLGLPYLKLKEGRSAAPSLESFLRSEYRPRFWVDLPWQFPNEVLNSLDLRQALQHDCSTAWHCVVRLLLHWSKDLLCKAGAVLSRIKIGEATCNNSHDTLVERLEAFESLGWSRMEQRITTAKHEGNIREQCYYSMVMPTALMLMVLPCWLLMAGAWYVMPSWSSTRWPDPLRLHWLPVFPLKIIFAFRSHVQDCCQECTEVLQISENCFNCSGSGHIVNPVLGIGLISEVCYQAPRERPI